MWNIPLCNLGQMPKYSSSQLPHPWPTNSGGKRGKKRESLDAVQALLNHIQKSGVLPTLLGQQI